MYIYVDYQGTARANISQSFTIPRTSEFYSDLSIAATLPIQIVSRVYEPFSRGVVSPFSPSCSTLLSHTNLLCEGGHRPDNRRNRPILTAAKALSSPFNDHFLPDNKSCIDFPCLRNGSVEMASSTLRAHAEKVFAIVPSLSRGKRQKHFALFEFHSRTFANRIRLKILTLDGSNGESVDLRFFPRVNFPRRTYENK